MRNVFALLLLAFAMSSVPLLAQEPQKDRLLVLTDIEADPDDTQSLIRLLLYANLIDIEGLVATTSVHMKTRVNPASIERVIRAYGEVHPNLSQHESGFPTAEELLGRVRHGQAAYGMLGVGEDKDSPGSDWILEVLEKDDERPLWISVWGGPNTLAQALYRIRETKTEEEAARLISKLRVYLQLEQKGHYGINALSIPSTWMWREQGGRMTLVNVE